MFKRMKKHIASYVLNERGANEIVTTGLVILFGCIVAAAAFVAINPSITTGIGTVVTNIANAFTQIAGL